MATTAPTVATAETTEGSVAVSSVTRPPGNESSAMLQK